MRKVTSCCRRIALALLPGVLHALYVQKLDGKMCYWDLPATSVDSCCMRTKSYDRSTAHYPYGARVASPALLGPVPTKCYNESFFKRIDSIMPYTNYCACLLLCHICL